MSQQTWNLHTHTFRCGHASGVDIQYIESAKEAGFKMLGFSEHIPFPEIRMQGARMFCEHKEEYLETMKKLQKKYKKDIEIKTGFEVEYLPEHLEYIRKTREECDYLILGQHLKCMIYDYDSYSSDEDVLMYATQVEEALSTGLFTYVAHPDYFMMGRRSFSKACDEAAHRIARASLQYDIPLEINLNGLSYGKKRYQIDDHIEYCHPYPFKEFWQIIALYGCKVVFGYDAHSPLTLLERHREIEALNIIGDISVNLVEDIQLR